MRTEHPLTVTVEQAAVALGVGRSTAYELVHSGELKCIRLRRRIVVPVAYLAETLGVDREAVWAVIETRQARVDRSDRGTSSPPALLAPPDTTRGDVLTLF